MRRNAKIIQISGLRGILTAIFIITCLAAGFVAFPGFVAMNIWNHFAGYTVPQINIYQGIMLWAIIALTCFITGKQQVGVSFASPKELSEEEMSLLMERIRRQSQARHLNKIVLNEKEEILKEEDSTDKETINK